ncbi:hypothetical protein SK128_008040 [Halocaridina rubra]|uniref:Uncharacterized protein n=1 Tax=Halocaridina rubra TaxID=373956 RepID=A0AAN9A868_HALRR
MGKSSSSSAGDHLSGAEEHRWTSVEPELPLGSAEDELWQLLDVIQRKGTRLRNELERAERAEREKISQAPPNTSCVSDPLTSPRPQSTYQDFWPHSLPGPIGSYPSRGDVLPPPPPPPPVGMGMEAEAWAAVDRLRQDRQYLVGRVNWAEAEAAASHQRLLDLHGQLLALASDKRRLEDQVRALRLDPRFDPRVDPRVDSRIDLRNDLNLQFVKTNGVRRDGPASTGGIVHSVMGGVNTVHIVSDNTTTTTNTSSTKSRRVPPAVTVSVASGDCEDMYGTGGTTRGRVFRSASSVRINNERDIVLPRVLKVPIRDRTQRQSKHDSENKDINSSSFRENKRDTGTASKDMESKEINSNIKNGNVITTSAGENGKGSDRVVIERERRAGKADGGLSMPVSLLKGGRIKVQPNKQRISAILREKDVLELQRQLLTTVMETEVLKKQIETASEEWVNKTAEWESEHRHSHSTIAALREENLSLKNQLDEIEKVERKDMGVSAYPACVSISTMTENEDADVAEAASHTVHPGPNIKYDVVVYEDEPKQSETNNNNTTNISATEGPARKVPPTVEKPPRRCRETRPSSSAGTWNSNHNSSSGGHFGRRESSTSEVSGGRDSLGRSAPFRNRGTLSHTGRSTPTVTPRSSPAPSINARTGALRASAQDGNRSTHVGRSGSASSTPINRMTIGRRDSLKTSPGTVNGNGKTNGVTGGQHKDSPLSYRDQSSIHKSGTMMAGGKSSPTLCLSKSSLDGSNSPLTLADLRSPSPPTSSLLSRKKLFVRMDEQGNKLNEKKKRIHTRLNASDVYNCELSDISSHSDNHNNNRPSTPTPLKHNIGSTSRNESVTSELKLSNLKSGSESSISSSLGSTGSYYDSINTDNNMDDERLMHVEVAFEWNPIPSEEIRYLPPAAHMWNPDHTLSPDKRLPPVRSPLCTVAPAWIPSTKSSAIFGYQTLSKSRVEANSNSQTSRYPVPTDSLEDDHHHRFEAMGKMRNKLRGMNGAVRVKNIDRPSVLSMVQGSSVGSTKDIATSRESLDTTRSHNSSSRTPSCDLELNNLETNIVDSLDRPRSVQRNGPHKAASVQCENAPVTNTNADLDSRVRQILAHITATAQ